MGQRMLPPGFELQPRWPKSKVSPLASKLSRLSPSVAVFDVDRDGFQDLLFATGTAGGPGVRLLRNVGGVSFVDETAKYFSGLESPRHSTVLAVADLNADGWSDVLVARYGAHSLYIFDPKKSAFIDRSDLLNGYHSNPWSVALVDFNRDGRLDILFGNYYPDIDMAEKTPPWFIYLGRGDEKFGGQNHLLEATDAGYKISGAFTFKHKAHTTSVGVSDLNHDGYPDLFEGNDFALDHLYINQAGKKYVDATKSNLPISEHGMAGMNSEFFDYDMDGQQELYVSNISQYPVSMNGNILWTKKGKGFENKARQLGISRCGWSWGAKFSDFDLDGNYDLYVVNGAYSGESKESVDYWYYRSLKDASPAWARNLPSRIENGDLNWSGYQKDCLFESKSGRFVDVADNAGVADEGDGKGLALADLNNDGLTDVIVVNMVGRPKIYMNRSCASGVCGWVGIRLVDKAGGDIPVGAEVRGGLSEKKVLFREIYPLNGKNAQSDARIVLALSDPSELKDLQVRWPDGKIQAFNGLKMNRYNELKQDVR